MASLLSVLLVSSSSSGSRLLFAYPPNAVATPRVQRPLYGKSLAVRDIQARSPLHEHGAIRHRRGSKPGSPSSSDDDEHEDEDEDGQDRFGSRFIRGESSSSSSASSSSSEDEDDAAGEDYTYTHDEYLTREQRQKESYKVHLGIDTSVLGTLLCPSSELCNKRFEMVINHLAFIAHPVAKRPKQSQHATSRSARQRADKTLSRTNTYETTFGSDEEEEELAGAAASSGLLERRRGRRPRDLRTSIGGESVQARLAYNNNGRSQPGSGTSSRRTSHSMPNGGRPTYPWQQPYSASRRGSSATAAAAGPRDASADRKLSDEPSGSNNEGYGDHPFALETKESTTASSSSMPPPRSRHLHSSHLQMSTSSAGPVLGSSGSNSADLPSATTAASATSHGAQQDQEESDLNVFSIVLVIDSPPDQHLTYHLGVYYRDVIAPVMAALKSIERSAGYMTREAELIASMRERAVEAGKSRLKTTDECKEAHRRTLQAPRSRRTLKSSSRPRTCAPSWQLCTMASSPPGWLS